jgi:hypothetical protein
MLSEDFPELLARERSRPNFAFIAGKPNLSSRLSALLRDVVIPGA